MKKALLWIIVLFFAILTVGCQATKTYYLGAGVERSARLPVAEAGQSAMRWQDDYVIVDFDLTRETTSLTVAGTLDFTDYSRIMYVWASYLKVQIFFLDVDGKVVDYAEILPQRGRDVSKKHKFNLSVPQNVAFSSVSFGYETTFVDDEGSGSMVKAWPTVGQ